MSKDMIIALSNLPPLPRTLILDYYDSYTNNLLTLFTQLYTDEEVLNKVVIVKADRYTWEEFKRDVIPEIDCVILSPGPGRPDNPSDIGFGLDLLRSHPLPILGVCLGHQAIGVAFRGKIVNTPQITHGHVLPILPVSPPSGLFASKAWQRSSQAGGEKFDAVVYNSLTIDPESLPEVLEITARSDPVHGKKSIQGVRHRDYPIWGVQYHPESISSTRGAALLLSFLEQVHHHHSSPPSFPPLKSTILKSCAFRSLHSASNSRAPSPSLPSSSSSNLTSSQVIDSVRSGGLGRMKMVQKRFGDSGRDKKTQEVFERVVRGSLGSSLGEIWLDGETPSRPTTTSLAVPSFILTYSLSTKTIKLYKPDLSTLKLVLLPHETFWDWLSEGQKALELALSPPGSHGQTNGNVGTADDAISEGGWKAGWVGWFTYEMKSESLDGYSRQFGNSAALPNGIAGKQEEEVDACWAWCSALLERREDGEWCARGLLSADLDHDETVSNGHTSVGGQRTSLTNGLSFASTSATSNQTPSLTTFLLTSKVSLTQTQTGFDNYISQIEGILTTSPKSHTSLTPATRFPTFHPVNSGDDYRERIDRCRENIRQGESYELTLTTQFKACLRTGSREEEETVGRKIGNGVNGIEEKQETGREKEAYSLYLRLRAFNPAYYSTWISFPTIPTPRGKGVHILSSSPERFLRITNADSSSLVGQSLQASSSSSKPSADVSDLSSSTMVVKKRRRRVEMKPIKGTRARVKVGECVCVPPHGCGGAAKGSKECVEEGRRIDKLRGEELQADLKERAENLMIVDLIRSDLLSSCTPSTVKVPQLIALETYGVHNLVTTVSGDLRGDVGGLEAVKKCFPPGSMTGAPKLRSVQLLDDLEGGLKRGIYSGALGYISICGAIDLSVVIRTIIVEGDQLSLGAGGAITWLSDRDGEWDEVLTKVKSVVGDLEGVI